MRKTHQKICEYCSTEFTGTARAKYCPESTGKNCRQNAYIERKKNAPEDLSGTQREEVEDPGDPIEVITEDQHEDYYYPVTKPDPINEIELLPDSSLHLDDVILKSYKKFNSLFVEILERIKINYKREIETKGLKSIRKQLNQLIEGFSQVDLRNAEGEYIFAKEAHELRAAVGALEDKNESRSWVLLSFGKGYKNWMEDIRHTLEAYNDWAEDKYYDERGNLDTYD